MLASGLTGIGIVLTVLLDRVFTDWDVQKDLSDILSRAQERLAFKPTERTSAWTSPRLRRHPHRGPVREEEPQIALHHLLPPAPASWRGAPGSLSPKASLTTSPSRSSASSSNWNEDWWDN